VKSIAVCSNFLPARDNAHCKHGLTDRMAPPALFTGRILPFDERAALVWGRMMAEAKRLGRPRSTSDAIIAATAVAHGCVVVTANTRDFRGVETFNPFEAT